MDPLLDHEQRIRALEKRLADLETRSRTSRWGTWTPTVTQGVAVSTSTAWGHYMTNGRLVVALFAVALSSAGTASNRVEIGGLPISFVSADRIVGGANIQDAGTRNIHVSIYTRTSSFWMVENNTTDVVGVVSAYTAASGDYISGYLVYEAA